MGGRGSGWWPWALLTSVRLRCLRRPHQIHFTTAVVQWKKDPHALPSLCVVFKFLGGPQYAHLDIAFPSSHQFAIRLTATTRCGRCEARPLRGSPGPGAGRDLVESCFRSYFFEGNTGNKGRKRWSKEPRNIPHADTPDHSGRRRPMR